MEINDIESFLKEKEKQLKKISEYPWEYGTRLSGSENHKGFYLKSVDGWSPAEIYPIDLDGKQGKLNAEFISQSPELVSMLIKMVKAYRRVALCEISEVHILRGCIEECGNEKLLDVVDREVQSILNENGKI